MNEEQMQQQIDEIVESYRSQSRDLERYKRDNEALLEALRTVRDLLAACRVSVSSNAPIGGALALFGVYVQKKLERLDPSEIPF